MLLGVAVLVVVGFQRLHIPSSLAYLLVGVLLGPYTIGPVIDFSGIRLLAEFGIVFLLFTIGLNFSLPQLHALRHQVLGLGTGQVAFTTLTVGLGAWAFFGMPAAAAFVVGAVFAQSSTTIIGKQLAEQGEENSRHGRLGLAMSVFQDVTAVPFIVVIPVLGSSAGGAIAGSLAWALAQAVLAFALVFFAGRWLLHPLFRLVVRYRSAEVFTLTVLLVALLAAWTTSNLGLSLAFGAFLAGMMLGETEFRHQVESTIRPFRDVLLGLFFVGIGALFDPTALPEIWHWGLLGAVALISTKSVLVMLMVRRSGGDKLTAWRTGLLLGVGGEFGLALLALALEAKVIDTSLSQILLASVLFSIIAGPYLIRYSGEIATRLSGPESDRKHVPAPPTVDEVATVAMRDHVIICGYGRIGQSVGNFLEEERIPFIALDLDPQLVRDAHIAGEPVYYGDASERDLLEQLGLDRARLVVISHDDTAGALKTLHHLQSMRPALPVMVRTRDETHVEALQAAGALEVVPETLEAGLMVASQALLLLDIPHSRVQRRIQQQREQQYRLMREFFRGDAFSDDPLRRDSARLRSLVVAPGSAAIGKCLHDLDLQGVTVTALVRKGMRHSHPGYDTQLEENDVLVLFGPLEILEKGEALLAD